MGNGDVHVYDIHKFQYDGWVTSWIVNTHKAGSFYIDVCRPDGGTYKLIGMNLVTVGSFGVHVCIIFTQSKADYFKLKCETNNH